MSTYNVNYNKVSLSQWNVRMSIEEVTLMQKKHEIMKQYHTKYSLFLRIHQSFGIKIC